jgi:hypothetical protein
MAYFPAFESVTDKEKKKNEILISFVQSKVKKPIWANIIARLQAEEKHLNSSQIKKILYIRKEEDRGRR